MINKPQLKFKSAYSMANSPPFSSIEEAEKFISKMTVKDIVIEQSGVNNYGGIYFSILFKIPESSPTEPKYRSFRCKFSGINCRYTIKNSKAQDGNGPDKGKFSFFIEDYPALKSIFDKMDVLLDEKIKEVFKGQVMPNQLVQTMTGDSKLDKPLGWMNTSVDYKDKCLSHVITIISKNSANITLTKPTSEAFAKHLPGRCLVSGTIICNKLMRKNKEVIKSVSLTPETTLIVVPLAPKTVDKNDEEIEKMKSLIVENNIETNEPSENNENSVFNSESSLNN